MVASSDNVVDNSYSKQLPPRIVCGCCLWKLLRTSKHMKLWSRGQHVHHFIEFRCRACSNWFSSTSTEGIAHASYGSW